MTTRVSGQLGPDLAAGLDAGAVGQPDVHDDDVGLVEARLVDRFGDGPGLGDDLEALAPVEQRDEALADDLVVVDDEQAQRSGGLVIGHACGSVGFVRRSRSARGSG